MTGLSLGLGLGLSTASSAITLTPGTLTYASVRFPPENGEDPVSLSTSTAGEHGLLYLASSSGSANLVSSASKWMGSAGALIVTCTLDELIYDGINRAPYLVGTDIQQASQLARNFALRYTPRVTQSNTGKEHRFSFIARGESAESNGVVADSVAVPAGVNRILVAARFDGTNFFVDLWDCETGTKYAGATVAKSGLGGTGWVGIGNLTRNVTIGCLREDRYPLMSQSLTAQTINAFRGEMGLVAMLDTNPSDANLQAVALGADPLTVFGSANCRMFANLADGNGATFPITSNRAFFSSGATLTKKGTLYPGSTIRRQNSGTSSAPTLYLTVDRLPDPCLVGMAPGGTRARLPVSFKIGGTTGAIQVRIQDEDGNIVGTDWQAVVTASGATASGAVSLPWHPSDKAYRLTFRIPNGAGGYLYAYANTDVVVSYTMVHMGQSEMVRALGYNVTNTGATGNPLGLTYSVGASGGKYVYRVVNRTTNDGTVRAAIIRSRFNYYLGGGGQIAMVNRLRGYTSKPLTFVDAAVSGTSALDFIDDAQTGRQWADFDTALSALRGKDASNRPVVTSVALMWEAFTARLDWSAQIFRPLITGTQSVTQGLGVTDSIAQADIDHYVNDGVSLAPGFRIVSIPANRRVGAGTATSDADTMADRRKDMRDNPATYLPSVIIGPECGVHALETSGTDAATHPDTARATGQLPWSRKIADGHALGIGVASFTRPVISGAAFAGGNTQIVVTVTGAAGASLDTEGNYYATAYGSSPVSPIGLAVSGFEVDDGGTGTFSNAGFTAAISASGTITLTKSSGSWAAGTKLRFNPGAPGGYTNNYGTGNTATEDAWVKNNPVFGGHEVAGDNTAWTVA